MATVVDDCCHYTHTVSRVININIKFIQKPNVKRTLYKCNNAKFIDLSHIIKKSKEKCRKRKAKNEIKRRKKKTKTNIDSEFIFPHCAMSFICICDITIETSLCSTRHPFLFSASTWLRLFPTSAVNAFFSSVVKVHDTDFFHKKNLFLVFLTYTVCRYY